MTAGSSTKSRSASSLSIPATKTIGFTGGEPLLEWQRFIALLAAMRADLVGSLGVPM